MRRRDFLKVAAASWPVLSYAAPRRADGADSYIDVFPAQEQGTISPLIYGQFTRTHRRSHLRRRVGG